MIVNSNNVMLIMDVICISVNIFEGINVVNVLFKISVVDNMIFLIWWEVVIIFVVGFFFNLLYFIIIKIL